MWYHENAVGKDQNVNTGKDQHLLITINCDVGEEYLRWSDQLLARGLNDFSCTRLESSLERTARSDKIPNSVWFNWVVARESKGILLHIWKCGADIFCNAFHRCENILRYMFRGLSDNSWVKCEVFTKT